MTAAQGTATGTSQPAPAGRADRTRPRVVCAACVALGGGASAAMMNTVNGRLGEAGAGALVAATTSYAVTLLGATALFVLRRRVRASWRVLRTTGSWWWFAVGLLAVPLVVGFAWGVPLIGVALAVVCTVAGQVVASLVLDALGVGAREVTALTPRRAGAAVLALGGAVVATVGGTEDVEGTAVIVAGALFLVGAVSVGGQAGSGRIMARIEDPFVAAMTTSTGGFVGLCVVVAAGFAGGAMDGLSVPTQGWMYLGGLFGLVVGIAGAFAVRHLGTFVLTITVLGGQMVTALTVDAFSPVGVHGLTLAATAAVVGAALLVVDRGPRTTPATEGEG